MGCNASVSATGGDMSNPIAHRRRYAARISAVSSLAAAAQTGYAQNRYSIDSVPTGNWVISANWAAFPGGPGGAGVPGPGDIARITHSNSTSYNVTLDV